MTKTKRRRQYGNSASYLYARIRRDHPDILEAMLIDAVMKGEFRSMRQGAIEAGIVKPIAAEDKPLDNLVLAWRRADLETRQVFLYIVEEEIDAAYDGKMLDTLDRKKPGPSVWGYHDDCPSDLKRLLEADKGATEIAKALGTTYRTIVRWKQGEAKPRAAQIAKLAELAAGLPEPGKWQKRITPDEDNEGTVTE